MHAKYEVSISYGSKVIAKVKDFCHRVTDSQTGQKLDAPKFHSGGGGGIKNTYICETLCPKRQQSLKKTIFKHKGQSQSHKVINPGVKIDRASLVEYACQCQMGVSISYGSKIIGNVKVDNGQTHRQTEHLQFAPDNLIWGHN